MSLRDVTNTHAQDRSAGGAGTAAFVPAGTFSVELNEAWDGGEDYRGNEVVGGADDENTRKQVHRTSKTGSTARKRKQPSRQLTPQAKLHKAKQAKGRREMLKKKQAEWEAQFQRLLMENAYMRRTLAGLDMFLTGGSVLYGDTANDIPAWDTVSVYD